MISSINEVLPDIEVRVAAIFRENKSIPIDGDTIIEVADEVFFIANTENITKVMSLFRKTDSAYKRIMIAGGGNIGSCLAAALENDYQVKVIDHNQTCCMNLAEILSKVTILCADASDKELLINENIEHTDVFCAMTNDDEANIMSSLQAKRLGARQAIALISRPAYVDLIEEGSINIAISPQQTTIGSILTHIRQGDIVNVHSLRRGAAEIIEAIAHGDKQTSKIVGHPIAKIKMPKETNISAIIRGEQIIIPNKNTTIQSGDHLVIFVSDKQQIYEVEKMFQSGFMSFQS